MRRFLLLFAAFCAAVPAFAQKSPKENAQVWLGLSTSIYAAADYSLTLQSSYPGESAPLDGDYTNWSGLSTAVTPGNLRMQVYPGREYQLLVYSSNWTTADLKFDVPSGYTLYMGYDDQGRTPATSYLASSSTMGLTYTVSIELRPNDGGDRLSAGYALPPRIGDVTWAVSLGSTTDGASAGTLRWRNATVGNSLLNSLSLVYVDPVHDEVLIERESNGAIKYVSTAQTQARIFRNTDPDTGYTLKFYAWNAVPGSDRNFTGYNPFVTYTISGSGGGGVQISRVQNATETWVLTSSTVTQTTGNRVTELTSTANTPTTGQRTEDVKVYYTGESSSPAASVRKIYQAFTWGEELISETVDPSGLNLTTTYTYHTSGWPTSGNAGKLASISRPDGSWEAYDYYDTTARWGQLNHIYRPWQNSPAAASSATTSNSHVTTLLYQARRSVYQETPAGSETHINGTQVGSTSATFSYSTQSDYDDSPYDTPLRTETIVASTSGSATLTTVRKIFDDGMIPYTGGSVGSSNLSSAVVANPVLSGRLYSETRPDGTRTSVAHGLGHWVSYFVTTPSAWDTHSFTAGSVNDWWSETFLNGTSSAVSGSDSSPITSWNGHTIEPVYLTPNRSTRKEVYRLMNGANVQTVTYIYTGSGNFKMIAWSVDAYENGLHVQREDSTGGISKSTYYAGRKTSETGADGTYVEYTLDSLFRVSKARRTGVSATGGFAAQGNVDTDYTYDAADRVKTTTVTGGSLSLSTSTNYDLAGRVTSHTDERSLTTQYEYAFDGTNGGSIVTTKFPGHTTTVPRDQVVKTWRDGSTKSVTGAAVANQYVERSVSGASGEGGFLITTTYALRSSDLSSPTGAPRWQRSVTDWVGRPVRTESPAYNGATFTKTFAYYAGTGQLKKVTETGLAPTYMQYDGLGELEYTWVDVDNDTNDSSPSPELSGPDRVTRTRTDAYDAGSGHWYRRTRTYTYNLASGSTALLTGEQRTKLVPYPGSNGDFDARKVYLQQHAFDVNANETVQTTVMDPTTRIATVTSNVPDSSVDAVVTAFNGRQVSVRSAQNLTTTFGYDALGRATTQTDPRIGTSTTAFYTSGTGAKGQVSSVTDPASHATSYAYDTVTGRLSSSTDALGKHAYQDYNVRGQTIRTWGQTTYPVEYAYNDYGELLTQSTFRGGSAWDGTTWPSSPGTADTTTWAYETATGLLLSKTDADSKAVNYTYNARGQLAVRTWARLVSGSPLTTTYSYDSSTGEQTGINYSDSTPDITYTYNRSGQMAAVADVTGSRTFDYSATNLSLTSETLPSYFGGRALTRKYATSGVIGRNTGYTLGVAGGSGYEQDITYDYDSSGRFNSLAVASGPSFTYAFASNSNLVASITEATSNGWKEIMAYESNRNLLASISGQYGTASKATFAYAHDQLGRRTSAIQTGEVFSRYAGSGLINTYGYNDRSEVTSSQSYHGTNLGDLSYPVAGRGFGYAFDNIGNRTSSSVIGTGSSDVRTTTYTSNNLNQITVRDAPASTDVTGLAPASATVTVNSTAVTRQGEYYFKNVAAGSRPLWQGLTAASSLGGSTTRYSFIPAANEAIAYDADGNITSDGRWNYTWDAENRLVSMETASPSVFTHGSDHDARRIDFAYDYLGRRVEKLVRGWNGSAFIVDVAKTRFVYNGWNVVAEYSTSFAAPHSLTLLRTNTWGLDLSGNLTDGGGVGGLLSIKDGSTFHLPVYDANGNVAGLVNKADGTVTAAYEYSPFGETLRATGSYAATNNFRFSTKYTDAETGLLWYGYRYYDAKMGRFLGRDPAGEQGGLNLYGFCGNNAVNRWDILGMMSEDEAWSIMDQTYADWSGGYEGMSGSEVWRLNYGYHEQFAELGITESMVASRYGEAQAYNPNDDPMVRIRQYQQAFVVYATYQFYSYVANHPDNNKAAPVAQANGGGAATPTPAAASTADPVAEPEENEAGDVGPCGGGDPGYVEAIDMSPAVGSSGGESIATIELPQEMPAVLDSAPESGLGQNVMGAVAPDNAAPAILTGPALIQQPGVVSTTAGGTTGRGLTPQAANIMILSTFGIANTVAAAVWAAPTAASAFNFLATGGVAGRATVVNAGFSFETASMATGMVAQRFVAAGTTLAMPVLTRPELIVRTQEFLSELGSTGGEGTVPTSPAGRNGALTKELIELITDRYQKGRDGN